MKKILCSLAMTLILISSLNGCAKCISTETSTVQVKIVDEYYSAAYMTPVTSGKVHTVIIHPAVYRITVEYNGVEYDISDSDTYDKYSNRVGEYVNGTLETKKYDDGTVRYNIISLE